MPWASSTAARGGASGSQRRTKSSTPSSTRSRNVPFCMAPRPLFPFQIDDRIGARTARSIDAHLVADLVVDARATHRRGDGNRPLAHVRLLRPHDPEGLLLARVHVLERDARAELDAVALHLTRVDHLGAREHALAAR